MNLAPPRRRAYVVALATLTLAAAAPLARACPFCNAAMQTLSQEIESADVALITQLVEPMPTSADGQPGSENAAAKFRIVHILRGAERLEGVKEINVVYFGDDDPQKRFFITGLAGVTGPGLDWTMPTPLTPRAEEYLRKLPTVPPEGADRLAFFQEYLEDEDALLAQDAYDEFARTPYDVVIELGPRMDRPQLLKWIQDPRVGPSGRRLYLTMLSICGKPEDVRMLEELMNYDYAAMEPAISAAIVATSARYPSVGAGLLAEMLHAEERRKRESLDAMIACYLKLKGPEGTDLVNRLFLGNPKVEYKHLHSAITAMRFLGEQTEVLPRERLLESMRLALDHDGFADQVIPDLTRWEDWELMPRLIAMFKASPKGDWVRLPVATYLLIAAEVEGDVGKQAAAAIAELEADDPETFEGARRNSDLGYLVRAAGSPGAAADGATSSGDAGGAPPDTADPPVPGVPQPGDDGAVAAEDSAGADDVSPDDPVAAEQGADSDEATDAVADAAASTAAAETPPLAATSVTPPSKIKIIGIPLLAAGVLLGIFAVLLRGADPRSSDEN